MMSARSSLVQRTIYLLMCSFLFVSLRKQLLWRSLPTFAIVTPPSQDPPTNPPDDPCKRERNIDKTYMTRAGSFIDKEMKSRGWCTDLHPGEEKLSSILKDLLLAKKSDLTVIDIGANKGEILHYFFNAFKSLSPCVFNVSLLGIEPGPSTFRDLSKTVLSWGAGGCVHVNLVNAAVGEKKKSDSYYAPKSCVDKENKTKLLSGCEQLTLDSIYALQHSYVEVGKVHTETLDGVLQEQDIDFVDVLYMDAQFLEWKILYGGVDRFNHNKFGVIVFEYSSSVWGSHFPVLWLSGYGYRIFILYNSNLIDITPLHGLYSLLTDRINGERCHVMVAVKNEDDIQFILSRYNSQVF